MIRINRLLLFQKSEEKILKLLENVSKKLGPDIRHRSENYQIEKKFKNSYSNKRLLYLTVILLIANIVNFSLYFFYTNNNSSSNFKISKNDDTIIDINMLYEGEFIKIGNRIEQIEDELSELSNTNKLPDSNQIEDELSELSNTNKLPDSNHTALYQNFFSNKDSSDVDHSKVYSTDRKIFQNSYTNENLSGINPSNINSDLSNTDTSAASNLENKEKNLITNNTDTSAASNLENKEKNLITNTTMEKIINNKMYEMQQLMDSKMEQAMKKFGQEVVQVLNTQRKRNEEIIEMDEEVIKSFQQLSELKDE